MFGRHKIVFAKKQNINIFDEVKEKIKNEIYFAREKIKSLESHEATSGSCTYFIQHGYKNGLNDVLNIIDKAEKNYNLIINASEATLKEESIALKNNKFNSEIDHVSINDKGELSIGFEKTMQEDFKVFWDKEDNVKKIFARIEDLESFMQDVALATMSSYDFSIALLKINDVYQEAESISSKSVKISVLLELEKIRDFALSFYKCVTLHNENLMELFNSFICKISRVIYHIKCIETKED
jgi:Holliday junction resolvase